ncbi:MAG: helix-turn-helix domain-containing protein [Cyclobacteriaceae bacterium]
MTPGTLIGIIGACQGILLASTILFLRRGPQRANLFLGLLILTFSFYVLEFALYWTNFFYEYPIFIFATVSFPLLFGPLLYFYARELSKLQQRVTIKAAAHLIPFALYILYLLPEYLSGPEARLDIFTNSIRSGEPNFDTTFYLIKVIRVVQLLIYLGLTIRLVQNRATYKGMHLKWMKLLVIGFLFFASVDALHGYQLYFSGYQNINLLGNLLFVVGATLIYFIGYKAWAKPELIVGNLTRGDRAYSSSQLSRTEALALQEKLKVLVKLDQVFLEDTLSLPSLAKKVGTSTHVLSQVLNDQMGMSFFDFINSHRIEEAKQRLLNPKYNHLSIVGIAYEVGFKNKASFNLAFNKFVGTTPSKFREKHLAQ